MARLLPALLLVLVFSTLLAQSQGKRGKPGPSHGPRICFTTDVLDAGNILHGSTYRYAFPFRNCGDEPLVITYTNSPSWISIKRPKDPIMPGKWDTVYVDYLTQGRLAPFPFSRSVFIRINDITGNQPNSLVYLYVKGHIVEDTSRTPTR